MSFLLFGFSGLLEAGCMFSKHQKNFRYFSEQVEKY